MNKREIVPVLTKLTFWWGRELTDIYIIISDHDEKIKHEREVGGTNQSLIE